MGARHQEIKKKSPSLLDKDLLMGGTENTKGKGGLFTNDTNEDEHGNMKYCIVNLILRTAK